MLKNYLLYVILILSMPLLAQKYPKGYFRNPMDIPIEIAGSFGELRPNHFHCGIDIRTHGKEGLPVYAAADGWLSRANVSGIGYGNCLYVSHSNGYTTVYAHLTRFSDAIQDYVKKIQYQTESFDQEVRPEPNKFIFKKGDIIGYSGNTGGSKAPHLHFEIRETISENALNPLLMLETGIEDKISPIIKAIRIYPKDTSSAIKVIYKNGIKSEALYGSYITLPIVSTGTGKYIIKNIFKIEAKGKVVLAIRAIDHIQDFASTVSPYSIDLCVEGERYFCQNLERLDFSKLKYINAHTDYQDWVQNGRWFERSHTLPNDSLEIYEIKKQNGVVDIKTETTKLNYIVRDLANNVSELNFEILRNENLRIVERKINKIKDAEPNYKCIIPFQKEFELDRGDFKMIIPPSSFYEDAFIEFKIKDFTVPIKGIYSHIYRLSPTYQPLQKEFLVGITPNTEIPEKLKSKICVISAREGYIGNELRDGKVFGKAKHISNYWIGSDSNPPKLIPLNFRNNGVMVSRTIKASISDDIAGISSFKGYLDGKWVLFNYDPKKALIYHEIEHGTISGEHILEFKLVDRLGNSNYAKYKIIF